MSGPSNSGPGHEDHGDDVGSACHSRYVDPAIRPADQ